MNTCERTLTTGSRKGLKCDKLVNDEAGQGRLCIICSRTQQGKELLNSLKIQEPSSTPRSESQRYKVISARRLDGINPSCSCFRSKKNDVIIAVIPAIADEELLYHLNGYIAQVDSNIIINYDGYNSNLEGWWIITLENEIARYLIEKKTPTEYTVTVNDGLVKISPEINNLELKSKIDEFLTRYGYQDEVQFGDCALANQINGIINKHRS